MARKALSERQYNLSYRFLLAVFGAFLLFGYWRFFPLPPAPSEALTRSGVITKIEVDQQRRPSWRKFRLLLDSGGVFEMQGPTAPEAAKRLPVGLPVVVSYAASNGQNAFQLLTVEVNGTEILGRDEALDEYWYSFWITSVGLAITVIAVLCWYFFGGALHVTPKPQPGDEFLRRLDQGGRGRGLLWCGVTALVTVLIFALKDFGMQWTWFLPVGVVSLVLGAPKLVFGRPKGTVGLFEEMAVAVPVAAVWLLVVVVLMAMY